MTTPNIDLEHLLASAPDGILIADEKGEIVLTNEQVSRIFGYEREELIGRPVELLMPEARREAHVLHRERYFEKPTTRPMGLHLDLVGRRKDGEEFPVEISLSPFVSDGRRLVTAVIRDVSERRRLERERERLRTELETERERHRIGMDLHDGIMQAIYAVGLTLELAAEDLAANPEEARANMERAIDQLHGVVRDIRSYIFDLRPREYTGDLGPAVANLAAEFRQNSQIETLVDVGADLGGVPDEVGVALYHVTHEALSNVRRHARARSVLVGLERNGGTLRLRVSDDGRGFDPTAERGQTHRGLRNIATRVAAAGGTLEVKSAPGAGTTIIVEVPLPESPA
ncbi:MAG TPA: PAS domain-containing sensor histidine kinase [Dehalococcoidia bacterium]|nr:PAS domain-containing sensor histidine kinase [Dehalococcoidia bacterium]